MANSIQKKLKKHILEEENEIMLTISKTENNDLEVEHKITVPEYFNFDPQNIQLVIRTPTMEIIPKNSKRASSIPIRRRPSMRYRKHRKSLTVEKRKPITSSNIHEKSNNQRFLNISSSSSDYSVDPKSPMRYHCSKVQDTIKKFNSFIERKNNSKKTQGDLNKSIDNLTDLLLNRLGASVDLSSNHAEDITNAHKKLQEAEEINKYIEDLRNSNLNETNSDSEDEQKSVEDYPIHSVRLRIEQFNDVIKNMDECRNAREAISKSIEHLSDFIECVPATSVDDSHEHQSNMKYPVNTVRSRIEQFNALIEDMNEAEKAKEALTKSIEDVTNFIQNQPGTSIDIISHSAEEQKSSMDAPVITVRSKIEKFNSLIESFQEFQKMEEVITKSLEDLANFINSQPGTSVDTSSDSGDDQKSSMEYPVINVRSRIAEFNALMESFKPSEKLQGASKKSNFSEDQKLNNNNLFEKVPKANQVLNNLFDIHLSTSMNSISECSSRNSMKPQVGSLLRDLNRKNISFDFNSESSPSYETVKKYLAVMKEFHEKKDYKIIEELIMQRFQNSLEKVANKSSALSNNQGEKLSGDSGNDSTCEHCQFTSFNTSVENKECAEQNYSVTANTSQQFFEEKMLGMPPPSQKGRSRHWMRHSSGPKNRNTFFRNSVGTSRLSDLVSAGYDPVYRANSCQKSEATYASVSGSADWTISSRSNTMENSDSEEEATVDEENVKKSGGENSVVSQIAKALQIFHRRKCSRENLGIIEAERLLLTANLRTMCSMENMLHSETGNINESRIRYFRLSNIVVPLTHIPRRPSSIRFFVFVFRCGPNLFYSELLWPNEDLQVKTDEIFVFREIPYDFEVIFQIYSMKAKIIKKLKSRQKSSKGRLQKLVKKVFGLRRRASSREGSSKMSSFLLSGEGRISRCNMNSEEFEIINPRSPLEHFYTCDVYVSE